MSKKALTAAGVDNTFRRTWDKEEFEKKAAEREKEEDEAEESALDIKRRKRLERDPLHQGLIVQRANLQGRGHELQLDAKLGKSQIVSQQTPLSQQAGYYCSVCDCILRDSASYLDHINGKWHNRALGMSMRVERVSVDKVRKKFEALKKAREDGSSDAYAPDGFERAVQQQKEAEERQKQDRRDRKRRKRDDEPEEDEDEEGDPNMMALMGFGGFK